MESRPSSVTPPPEKEDFHVKTEVVEFNNVVDLKSDKEVSRYFGKMDNRYLTGDSEDSQVVDTKLSLLNANNVYYRRESMESDRFEHKKSDIEKICGLIKSEHVDRRLDREHFGCDEDCGKDKDELYDHESCRIVGPEARRRSFDEEKVKDISVYRLDDKIRFEATSPKVNHGSDDNKMETMENMPLDLSVRSEIRDSYVIERRRSPSPGCRDSYTDSDDSDGPGGKKHGGKAYKKSLMKRYRKCLFRVCFLLILLGFLMTFGPITNRPIIFRIYIK